MAFDMWWQMALVCSLGAISPGPSLAVVLRNTVAGGRGPGIMCGLGHGIAFTIYSGLAITGIAILLSTNPAALVGLQVVGALFLAWIAGQMLHASRTPGILEIHAEVDGRRGFYEGFLIAFLNPKILAFLTAVFSQFVSDDLTTADQIGMAALAGIIDGGWYVLVAAGLAGTPLLETFQQRRHVVDGVLGTLLLVAALLLLAGPIGLL